MSLFNLPVEKKIKATTSHPWTKTIKDYYADRIKRSHNSVRNVVYPTPKEKIQNKKRKTFTIFGNRVTKEFIYCVTLMQGMHKYRWKDYCAPIIRGCTEIEWPKICHDLKVQYGGLAHCLKNQVAVICDDQLIGGEEELKTMIEAKHSYHLALNYQKESQKHFINYLISSGRPCVYMHISINGNPVGSLIFILYSDVVPMTCENFLRLSRSKRGGYSGTPVHRIVKDGWIQCGGFGLKNTDLSCENFIVPHDKRGVLGMANAGRNIDCSTQFYVLLQPHEWLNFKFVALGQLIDGEETLKKIENVETYYEAPTSDIIIYNAGIFNSDCKDIRINKGALEYLDGHVDDLVTIGEMFYEMLLERVWLELKFREIQRLQTMEGEGQEGLDEDFKSILDAESNFNKKHTDRAKMKGEGQEGLHDAFKSTVDAEGRKFMRKKDEETANKTETNKLKLKSKTTASRKVEGLERVSLHSVEINNDFDVDEYEYNPEEISYDRITPPFSVTEKRKDDKKYFVPWTDVPYPGEVDSNFDLKRMLQGDYCMESDLDPKQSRLEMIKLTQIRSKSINMMSNLISSFGGLYPSSSSSGSTEGSMDSDEKIEMEEYLRVTIGDKVCMPGKNIKKISRNNYKSNPLIENGPTDCFTDDELRLMRIALRDFKMQRLKKVTINPMSPMKPWATPTKIKRRQTGFEMPDPAVHSSHQGDVAMTSSEVAEAEKMRSIMKSAGEDDTLLTVSIDQTLPVTDPNQICRRQTGYYRLSDIPEPDELEEKKPKHQKSITTPTNSLKSSVRIASTHQSRMIPRHLSDDARGLKQPSTIRPSVLVRLLEDLATDDNKDAPTLKNYERRLSSIRE